MKKLTSQFETRGGSCQQVSHQRTSRHAAAWITSLAMTLGALACSPATAATVIYDSSGSGVDLAIPFDSGLLANSFKTGSEVTTLTGVSIWLSGPADGRALVGLYADTSPTSSPSSDGAMDLGFIAFATETATTRFDLSPLSEGWAATTLAANTRYWIGVTGVGNWSYAMAPSGTGVDGEYVYYGDQTYGIDNANTPFMMQISTEALPPTPVPAPLPVLGAVAALGWSRKLRRRIREARKTEREGTGIAFA